jgi:16S rRNA (uracil1498-N3)-methyltransferase
MTRRLHHPTLPPDGGEVELDEAASHHARVLRLGLGDAVEIFDGRGGEADGTIEHLGKNVRVRTGPPRQARRSDVDLTLVQCLPKGQKLESIVRMATELGATAFELARSERTVPSPSSERAQGRLDRLARVAREAARQCERDDLPSLAGPSPLFEVAGRAPADAQKLVFARDGSSMPRLDRSRPTWIVVGPEGGLSDKEVSALGELGYLACTLGPTVLRVETAAVVAVTLALDRLRVALSPDRS